MSEFKYEIKQYIGTVSTSPDGKYATEVNLISYNDAPAKVDIRNWNTETRKLYKGIVLTPEEADKLAHILLDWKSMNDSNRLEGGELDDTKTGEVPD